jgi:hypothetical protein
MNAQLVIKNLLEAENDDLRAFVRRSQVRAIYRRIYRSSWLRAVVGGMELEVTRVGTNDFRVSVLPPKQYSILLPVIPSWRAWPSETFEIYPSLRTISVVDNEERFCKRVLALIEQAKVDFARMEKVYKLSLRSDALADNPGFSRWVDGVIEQFPEHPIDYHLMRPEDVAFWNAKMDEFEAQNK